MNIKSVRSIKGALQLKSISLNGSSVLGLTMDNEIVLVSTLVAGPEEVAGQEVMTPRKPRKRRQARISLSNVQTGQEIAHD